MLAAMFDAITLHVPALPVLRSRLNPLSLLLLSAHDKLMVVLPLALAVSDDGAEGIVGVEVPDSTRAKSSNLPSPAL